MPPKARRKTADPTLSSPLSVREEPVPPSKLPKKSRKGSPVPLKKRGRPATKKAKSVKSKDTISDSGESDAAPSVSGEESDQTHSDAELPPVTPVKKEKVSVGRVTRSSKSAGEKRRRSEASALGDEDEDDQEGEGDDDAKMRLATESITDSDSDGEEEQEVTPPPKSK
ncbi:hypothetical protein SCHPADRAFT_761862 [Schizopora paradoxa]|uniref:Uncharacterized protein n=1 Tax=Schizopora paradoxa TaxID=27342 RepID=A0A0H2RGS8_9AGAM|nr:hypothetical protein SCHPADRAFT_761862 [Schizopora paradoxa]